jgi:flagellar motor switch/type III secretory pathway protein FliN
MTADVRPWLPAGCLDGDRLANILKVDLDAWSGEWFATCGTPLKARGIGDAALRGDLHSRTFEGEYFTVVASGRSRKHLLEALLGRKVDEKSLNEHDNTLLDALFADAMNDLLRLCDGHVAASGAMPVPAEPGISARQRMLAMKVEMGNEEIMRVVADTSTWTALVKAALDASGSTQGRELVDRATALHASHVTVRAIIGRACLGLGEVGNMEIGDIVILDARENGHAEVYLENSDVLIGAGKIESRETTICISF